MEGLTYGWRKASRSFTYHYIPDFKHKSDYQTVRSLCNQKNIEVGYGKTKTFLEEYEISAQYTVCSICKLKLEQSKQNNSKKQILNEIISLSIHDTHVLQKVTCDENNCHESGIAFVSITGEEKPHYCIKHNLRVQLKIKEGKEILV